MNELRGKLERYEQAEAMDGASPPLSQPEEMEEVEMAEPEPELVQDFEEEGEIAEWREVPQEPALNREVLDGVPRAPQMDPRTQQFRDIVL